MLCLFPAKRPGFAVLRHVSLVCLLLGIGVAVGCAQLDATGAKATADTGVAWTCQPCVQRADCGADWCVQFAADTYCAADCSSTTCAAGLSCKTLITEAGESVKACVPDVASCGSAIGTGDSSGTCQFDDPTTPSCCTGCGASGCQTNGCYGGWFCDNAACKCVASPTGLVCDSADATLVEDLGPRDVQPMDVPPGSLTPAGGTLPELAFAIVGDTRPAIIEDTAGYPAAIAKKIWQGVQGSGVPFAVTTGDYMFASAYGTQAAPQLDLYLGAAAAYSGLRLPAMGNHECTGATTSNCGVGNKDGITANFNSYLTKMLAPIGLSDPYYTFNVSAADGSWTAKFVFIAANAWSAAQGTWLEAELAKPTTYTFVVRHEPAAANTAPGVKPSEAIINKHPVTLRLVGHTHTYQYKSDTHEIIVGNGGAPLSGGVNYGYVLVKRRADAAIEFRAVDYSTGQTTSTFAIKADGSPAP